MAEREPAAPPVLQLKLENPVSSPATRVPISIYPQPQLVDPVTAATPPVFPQPQFISPAPIPIPFSAPPLPASSSSPVLEHLLHKNRLQEYTQRSSMPLPVYQTINEGVAHAPMFRSTVWVDGENFTSPNTFSHRKSAEQDVAKIALECITKRIREEGCPLTLEDTVFCKSILNEFAVKLGLGMPIYNTVLQPKSVLPIFISSLGFNGATYTGEPGKSKKEAEQLAARAVILSLLANSGSATTLSEIIRSKHKLYAGLNKAKEQHHTHSTVVPVEANTGPGFEVLVGEKKEVEAPVTSNNAAVNANLHGVSGSLLQYHEFKMPRTEPPSQAINLPITFVPSVSAQPLETGSNSAKRRRKNKKKSSKKIRIDDRSSVAAMPMNQASACSVAQ